MQNATKVQLKCDEERVNLLVSNADGDARLNEPKYLMGASVHFLSSLEAEITFYDGTEEIHKK